MRDTLESARILHEIGGDPRGVNRSRLALEEVQHEVDDRNQPRHLHEHDEREKNDALQSLPGSLCGSQCHALSPLFSTWRALSPQEPSL